MIAYQQSDFSRKANLLLEDRDISKLTFQPMHENHTVDTYQRPISLVNFRIADKQTCENVI